MSNLYLSDEILMAVEKPTRYIGNERNMCRKNLSQVDIRFALCFPDVYEIGMSNIGIQILYELLNRRQDTYCERVFSPWHDLDRILRDRKIPLFTLESQTPVKDCDFLGISMGYEMCYTNVLQILDLSCIPLHAADRTEQDPIVIGGGTCTANPEPVADFFDLLYIGEGEVSYNALLDLYRECHSRKDFLRKAAFIEGIYVPSLYAVEYNQDGTLASFRPKEEGIPEKVKRVVADPMDSVAFIEKPLVPFLKVTQDRVVLELMRGCVRGCRFCQAGFIYRPLREHSLEYLKKYAMAMMEASGSEEISLSSLSSSDYSRLPELLEYLLEETRKKKVNISLPSLRIDSFSLNVMNKVQDVKKSSLTFAAEAGTQRLRNVINKGISEEDILTGSLEAFRGGWNKVKMYFMLGLPTETETDRRGIAELCEKIAETYYTIPKENRIGKVQISASASFFVPKPFTPFQWAPMYPAAEYLKRAHEVKEAIRDQLNGRVIRFTYHEAEVSVLEGLFARGDRKLSKLIEAAYQKGALYDSWTDSFHPEIWQAAMEECGVDLTFYQRERPVNELLPWDFIDIGVSRSFLEKEWQKAMTEGTITPNCRQICSACGAACVGGGVCFESKN